MNPGQKPEWIELADSDKAIKHRQLSKGLPILAVAITAAIIGAGTIFAQPQELSVASADPVVSTSTQNSDQSASVVPAIGNASPTTSNSEPMKARNVSSDNSATNPSTASTSPTNPTNPTIASMPTKSGDDEADDEGDDEGNDD